MVSKIGVNVRPALDRTSGVMLQQSLLALPGVKQVTVTYPDRVEVHYDDARMRASHVLTVLRARGLSATL